MPRAPPPSKDKPAPHVACTEPLCMHGAALHKPSRYLRACRLLFLY